MGRFINCFTVVMLKFKMATILDLNWSISPQWVVIAKLFQSACVLCMRHIMCKLKLSQYPATHTSYMVFHCTTLRLK